MIKEIIQYLVIITFHPLQDNKPLSETSDLIIVKEKLVVIVINLLVYYIFLKVYL